MQSSGLSSANALSGTPGNAAAVDSAAPAPLKRRGVPDTSQVSIDPEVQAAYDLRAKERENALQQYAKRVTDLQERLVAKPWERPDFKNLYEVTVSGEASMTEEEQASCTKALFSEKAAVAQCLHRRNRRGVRVPADGSLAVRSDNGRLRALQLPNALNDDDTLGFEGYRRTHGNISNGWGFGCEVRRCSTPVARPPHASPSVRSPQLTALPLLRGRRTARPTRAASSTQ